MPTPYQNSKSKHFITVYIQPRVTLLSLTDRAISMFYSCDVERHHLMNRKILGSGLACIATNCSDFF